MYQILILNNCCRDVLYRPTEVCIIAAACGSLPGRFWDFDFQINILLLIVPSSYDGMDAYNNDIPCICFPLVEEFFLLPESSNLHVAKGGEAISDQTFGQMSQVNQSPSHDFDLKTLKSQNLHQTPSQSEKLQFKLNLNFRCEVCHPKSGIQWRKLCNQNSVSFLFTKNMILFWTLKY